MTLTAEGEHAVQLPPAQARARRAVRAFRDMTPMLTAFARNLTGKPMMYVLPTHATTHTDGKNIYIRPPIELGDQLQHDPYLCHKRGDDKNPLCAACLQREEILVSLCHEVGHVVYGSFDEFVQSTVSVFFEDLVIPELRDWKVPEKRIEKVRETVLKNPPKTYLLAADVASPHLPSLLNALEDTRVNARTIEARPGMKVMFEASTERIFSQGLQRADGSVALWREAPVDAQMEIALFLAASGYNIPGALCDEVMEDVQDPELQELIAELVTLRGPDEVFFIAFKFLKRLRELGYLMPGEFEQEQDGEEEDGEGDPQPGDSQQQDGQTTQFAATEEDAAPSQGSGDEESGDEDSDNSGGGDSGESSADDTGDESDDTDDDTDAEGAGDDADDTDDASDDEGDDQGGGGDDASDTEADDTDDDEGAGGGDTEADDDDDDEEGAGGGDTDDTESDDDADDDTEGVGDGDDDTESDSDADGDNEEGDVDDDDDEPSSASEEDDDDDAEGEAPEDEPEPIDPEELTKLVREFHGHHYHEPEDDSSDSGGEGDDHSATNTQNGDFEHYDGEDPEDDDYPEDDVENSINQEEHFDAPSRRIGKLVVREHGDRSNWQVLPLVLDNVNPRYEDAAKENSRKLVQELRVVFSDNKKHKKVRNKKSGRINAKVLGRRVPIGDERLFQSRRRPGKRDYRVLIGLDVSGSTGMNATVGVNRLDLIKNAGFSLAELLNRLGVNFDMYGHDGAPASVNYNYGDELECRLWTIKSIGQHWDTEARKRLSSLRPGGYNLDGHTLEFYRKRVLESHRASDYVIVYFTDGEMPAENYTEEREILEREIKILNRHGVTLVGVGIATDSPKQYGMDTVKIYTPNDVKEVVKKLGEKLV